MSTEFRKLNNDLVIKFVCSSFQREEPVINRVNIPLKKSGLFLHRANLEKGADYSLTLKYGSNTILAITETLPFDWKNPMDWAFQTYGKIDKKLIRNIPIIGQALESLIPDAKWNFDLWYEVEIDEHLNLDYKLHFGPTPTVEVRRKYEGKYKLPV